MGYGWFIEQILHLTLNIAKGWGVAYDAIGVLSMLASMNGSGSGDPELRRVRRERVGIF